MRKATPTLALFSLGLLACGGQGTGTTTFADGKDGIARLRVALSSSGGQSTGIGQGPKARVALEEAIVNIDRVTVQAPGGWITLRDSIDVRVDVLRLADSAADLGFADLPSGKIGQIRLHVDGSQPPYVTTADGVQVPMKVPSGEQSGLKIKGHWELDDCAETTINLELDGKKAIWIHPTGKEDLYILRPVIKAGSSVVPGDCNGDPSDETPPGEADPPTDGIPVDGDDPGEPTEPAPLDPGSADPGSEPGTGEPGTGEPGTGEPGTGEPGTGEPGTGEPTDPTSPGGGCESSLDCGVSDFCNESGVCQGV